jgi:hypothetical protein
MALVSEQRDDLRVSTTVTPLDFARAPAQIAIIAIALIGLLLVLRWDMLLNDPDSYWHIEIGRWIVANKAFPQTDLWSHTFAGQPWIAKEWLSQVLLFLAHAAGGWRGTVIVTLAAYLGSLGYLAYWMLKRVQWHYAVAVIAIIMMLSAGSVLARPHVLALPAVVAWTLGLLSNQERTHSPPWWLIVVMILWSNLHAGFTIGFVIAAFIGLEAIIKSGKDWFKIGLQWAAFGVLAIGASCVGPYNIEPYLITIKLFGANEAVSRIDEWKPLAMDGVGIAFVSIFAALMIGLGVRFKQNWARMALIGILGAMMIQYTRFGILFAFTAFPIALAPLVRDFKRRLAPDHDLVRALPNWLAPLFACGFVGALLLAPMPMPSPLTSPEKALAAARAAGISGSVYNSYGFGGFLIYHRVPTYIDGRTDQLFIDGFMSQTQDVAAGTDPAPLVSRLDKAKVAWALLDVGANEASLLQKAGWRLVYQDDVAVVLAKPS